MGRIRIEDLDAGAENALDPQRLREIVGGAHRPVAEDQVLVVFEPGELNRPYVIGSLWNGNERPPERR